MVAEAVARATDGRVLPFQAGSKIIISLRTTPQQFELTVQEIQVPGWDTPAT